MPLVTKESVLNQLDVSPDAKNSVQMGDLEKNDDSILDITRSSFILENTIGSAIDKNQAIADVPMSREEAVERKIIPDFNPMEHIPQGFEQYAEMFAYTNDKDEVSKVVEHIEGLQEAQKIRARNPVTGTVTSMAAGILDWPTFIPTLGAAGAATRMGQSVRGALAVGATAAGTVGIQEYMLRQNQGDTRPMAVSGLAIASAAIFGGVLGAAAPLVSKGTKGMGEALVNDGIADGAMKVEIDPVTKSVQLQGVDAIKNAEGLSALDAAYAKIVSGPEFLKSISLRGVLSESGNLRKVTNSLFEHPFILVKERAGKSRGAVYERLINQGDIDRVKLNRSFSDNYMSYLEIPRNMPGNEFAAAAKSRLKNKLTYTEFDIEVGKALRRGDVHNIPQVQAAAQAARKSMNAKVKQMQELGILDETLDTKTATSYLTRRWNTDMVVAQYDELFDISKQWFKEQNPTKTDLELDELTRETLDNVMGIGDQALAMSQILDNAAGGGGTFTKQRMWLIPDERVEKFLDSRASTIVSQYLHEADALISMKRVLRENNWETVTDAKKAIRDEYQLRVAEEADPHVKQKLNKQMRKDLDLAKDMFNIALGKYGPRPNSALRTFRMYNSWRMLGGMTLSAMPDIAMHPFKSGLPSTVLDGLASTARSFGKQKLAKDQLQDLAGYFELESSRILRNLTDPDYRLASNPSKFHQAVEVTNDLFGKLSLMSYWNNAHKRMAGHISFSRTIRELRKSRTGKLSEKETLRLNQLNISPDDYEMILKQFDKHGEEASGSYIGNFHLWTDKAAKDKMSRAVLTDVNSTILTPGLGDLPRFVPGNELGSLVFQFKTFLASATNNITIKGFQRRDAEVVQGLIGLVSLGALRYVVGEQMLAGREANMDIDNLLIEGISRSGVAGLMGEYILGVSNAFFGEYGSRYGGRSIESLIGGPSASYIREASQALINSTDGEVTDSDAKRIKRLLPFSNLFYMRMLMTKLRKAQEQQSEDQ